MVEAGDSLPKGEPFFPQQANDTPVLEDPQRSLPSPQGCPLLPFQLPGPNQSKMLGLSCCGPDKGGKRFSVKNEKNLLAGFLRALIKGARK